MAWDAALKLSDVQLELLKEEDKYLFIEQGIRGGISTITKRFAKANNENIAGYDIDSELIHLLYIDANNLYGELMSFNCHSTVRYLHYCAYFQPIVSFISFFSRMGYESIPTNPQISMVKSG